MYKKFTDSHPLARHSFLQGLSTTGVEIRTVFKKIHIFSSSNRERGKLISRKQL